MRHSTPSSPSLRHSTLPERAASDKYADDVDIDQFAKTLSNIKAKNVGRPDLLASIITHYASKWLPAELSSASPAPAPAPAASPAGSTAAWLKKRFLVENLITILPPEREHTMPCDFLFRLLRSACMVGAGPAYMEDLENRVARQLDRADLTELMIPAFSHTCGMLLDVGLVVRLVGKFMAMEEATRSGAAMVKVARLVDLYLAEVALDAGLTVEEFEQLAVAVPSHARAADDGLYRAVDTYIKAHPKKTKQEKRALSSLIDPRKLSPEAAVHAVHNERLPVRSVIQVMFSEQSRVNRATEWSGHSFNGTRSPGRCTSKREVLAQQQEIRNLKDDVGRLQTQCRGLQAQIDRLGSDKKKKGIFRWSNFLFRSSELGDDDYEVGLERRTPRTPMKGRTAHGKGTPKWRNSLS